MKDLKESFAEINQRWKDCYDDERIPIAKISFTIMNRNVRNILFFGG